MRQARIVVVGAGFAGIWAAMGAARLLRRKGAAANVAVTVVSPGDALVIKPRLYESDLGGVRVPLRRLLPPVGIEHRQAIVQAIDLDRRRLELGSPRPGELRYDQLVLCAGGESVVPERPSGVHRVDSYEGAVALQGALAGLANRPRREFSATVVGAGFAGIEIAAELSDVLRRAAVSAGEPPEAASVLLVEREDRVAPGFGPSAGAAIESALRRLGIEVRAGAAVAAIDAGGATLADGERLDSSIAVWAGPPRASGLVGELGVELDPLGRLPVDAHLATGVDGVWAAGDVARVIADGRNLAPMSCQHAMPQGRQAGHNAAAALLGRRPGRYAQPLYLTCLDLGSVGALLTSGFERDAILARGARAKRFKRFINRSLIYPPDDGDVAARLGLGRRATPGRAGAKMQRMALRSETVRGLVISRSEDRAERHATRGDDR